MNAHRLFSMFLAALLGLAFAFVLNPTPASAKTRKRATVCKGATVIPFLSDTSDNELYGFTSMARDYSGAPGSLKGTMAWWGSKCDPARKYIRRLHKAEVIFAIASHNDYDGYFIKKGELFHRTPKKGADENITWEEKELEESEIGELLRRGLDESSFGDMLAGDRDGLPHGRKGTLAGFARAARKASGIKTWKPKQTTVAKVTKKGIPQAEEAAHPSKQEPTKAAKEANAAPPANCTAPDCPPPPQEDGSGGDTGGGPSAAPAAPESGKLQ